LNERLFPPHGGLLFGDYGAGAAPIIDGQDTRDCIDVNHHPAWCFRTLTCAMDWTMESWSVVCTILGSSAATVHGCGNDNILISDDCYNVRITNVTSYSPMSGLPAR